MCVPDFYLVLESAERCARDCSPKDILPVGSHLLNVVQCLLAMPISLEDLKPWSQQLAIIGTTVDGCTRSVAELMTSLTSTGTPTTGEATVQFDAQLWQQQFQPGFAGMFHAIQFTDMDSKDIVPMASHLIGIIQHLLNGSMSVDDLKSWSQQLIIMEATIDKCARSVSELQALVDSMGEVPVQLDVQLWRQQIQSKCLPAVPPSTTGGAQDGRMAVQSGGFLNFQARRFWSEQLQVGTLEDWLRVLPQQDPRGRFSLKQIEGLFQEFAARRNKKPLPAEVLKKVQAMQPPGSSLPQRLEDSIRVLPVKALEPAHIQALLSYSVELYEEDGTTPCKYQLYSEFNRVCREMGHAETPSPELLQDWELFRPFYFFLNAAIRALPKVAAVLFRGSSRGQDPTAYPLGGVGAWGGAVSATSDRRQAVAFVDIVEKSGLKAKAGSFFMLLSDEARPMYHISAFPEEMEHLHPLDEKFEVCAVLPTSLLQMLSLQLSIVTLKVANKSLPLEVHFDALEHLAFIYDDFLGSYIPPFVKLTPYAREQYRIEQRIQMFVSSSDRRVLLLAAKAGMGKTSCSLWLTRQTRNLNRIWLFISLPAVHEPFGPQGLVNHLQTTFGFHAQEMQKLQQQPLVLVLDSLDEVPPPSPVPSKSLLQLNGLAKWDIKLIVTCREEHIHSYGHALGASTTLYLQPFTEAQIGAYVDKRLMAAQPRDLQAAQTHFTTGRDRPHLGCKPKAKMSPKPKASAKPRASPKPKASSPKPKASHGAPALSPAVEKVLAQIQSSSIRVEYSVPFRLSMGMDLHLENVMPFEFARSTELYATWMRHFLAWKGLEDIPTALLHLEQLAWELHRQSRVSLQVGDRGQWAWFKCAPLRVHNYHPDSAFSFKHKSIQEFLVACYLYRLLGMSDARSELSAIDITSDFPVLKFLAGLFQTGAKEEGKSKEEELQQTLWDNVAASKGHPEQGQCAANSISILNVVGASFVGRDLSGVHIPKANLQCSFLRHCNFSGTNLQGALLTGAVLDFCNLEGADLTAVAADDLVNIFEGHTNQISCVAFSPDGSTIASGDDDGLKLWSTSTNEMLQEFNDYDPDQEEEEAYGYPTVKCLAFSPDSSVIAYGSGDGDGDGVVRLRKASTGEVLQTVEGDSVAYAPDGSTVVTVASDTTLKLWSTSTGGLLRTCKGHADLITSVAFSPDGQSMGSGSSDGLVLLWSPLTGGMQRTLKGHTKPVVCVAFSPDGKAVASGAGDNTVRLWNVSTGNGLKTLQGDAHATPFFLAFSPDGSTLAAGCLSKVLLWNLSMGEVMKTFQVGSRPVPVAFSPDGRTIATGSSSSVAAHVQLWSASALDLVKNAAGHTEAVCSVAFSPDGSMIASGGSDALIQIWSALTGVVLQTLEGHVRDVKSVAFSPDGSLLASGSDDNTVQLWSVAEGKWLNTIKVHKGSVHSVTFSPDGSTVASAGSSDGTVCLCSASTGKLQRTLQLDDWPNAVAFSPDGSVIATGIGHGSVEKEDNLMQLWNACTGDLLMTRPLAHFFQVHSLAFSPDGTTIASGGGQLAKVWSTGLCMDPEKPKTPSQLETDSGEVLPLLHTLETEMDPDTMYEDVYCVAFSPDGSAIVAGLADGTVQICSASTGELMHKLQGHTNEVASVAFSPDGATIVSGSADKTVRLWSASTGECHQVLRGFNSTVLQLYAAGARISSETRMSSTLHYTLQTAGASNASDKESNQKECDAE